MNPKHYSNALESIKIIGGVVIPYVNAQREILSNPNQAALLIFDVFRGQIIDEVTSHLLQNNIYFVTVHNTHLFQQLTHLFQQADSALQVGTKLEDINNEVCL